MRVKPVVGSPPASLVHVGAAALAFTDLNTPPPQNAAYTVVLVTGFTQTSVAFTVGSPPPVIFVHVTPASVLRYSPFPVAPKSRDVAPGETAMRPNRVPTNVDCPSSVHVAAPSVDFNTPAP